MVVAVALVVLLLLLLLMVWRYKLPGEQWRYTGAVGRSPSEEDLDLWRKVVIEQCEQQWKGGRTEGRKGEY